MREVGECDGALVGSLIPSVELGVGKAPAKSNGVLPVDPNGVCRRHESVLEHTRKSSLGVRAIPDIHAGVGDKACVVRGDVSIVINNGQAWEEGGAKGVNAGVWQRETGELLNVGSKLLWRERLVNGAIDLFANEAENFRYAESRRKSLRIGDGGHLAAGIQMLGEPGRTRIGVRGDAGVVLVIVQYFSARVSAELAFQSKSATP